MNDTPQAIHEHASSPPRLACYLNLGTLNDPPAFSTVPRGSARDVLDAIAAAGYEGVQGGEPEQVREAGLAFADGGRVSEPEDAEPIARRARDHGAVAVTLHAGWGLEDDATMDRLVDAVLDASARHDVPMYIETHRATITQDIFRTVQLCGRRPGLGINADFSHWYTGLEMPYGTVERKLDYAACVFERVRFMHGRIGNSGCMQVDVGETFDQALAHKHVQHFMDMWTRAMVGFLRHAGPGDVLVFAPELLQSGNNYARTFPGPDGTLREESDRWQQALLYCDLARHCFDQARSAVLAAG